jgi:hypothetical protein
MIRSSLGNIEAINQKYPIRLFDIRLSVYNGALRCRIREERALIKGTSYRTADGESVKISSIMVPTSVPDDRELTHSVWVDDESKVDAATDLLRSELLRNTQARIDDLQASLRIAATSKSTEIIHRPFHY